MSERKIELTVIPSLILSIRRLWANLSRDCLCTYLYVFISALCYDYLILIISAFIVTVCVCFYCNLSSGLDWVFEMHIWYVIFYLIIFFYISCLSCMLGMILPQCLKLRPECNFLLFLKKENHPEKLIICWAYIFIVSFIVSAINTLIYGPTVF